MLTHLDSQGRANMVDVTEKAMTYREAPAQALVRKLPETLQMIVSAATLAAVRASISTPVCPDSLQRATMRTVSSPSALSSTLTPVSSNG